MQIVIDIPNSIYANLPKIANGSIASKRILDCVKNGTQLPKGHGRLLILSEDKLKEYLMDLDFSCQKWINEVNLCNSVVAIIDRSR